MNGKRAIGDRVIEVLLKMGYYVSWKAERKWQFECHETFAQEVTVNEKLCKNIAFKTSSNIYFEYLLELHHWGDSNKYQNICSMRK